MYNTFFDFQEKPFKLVPNPDFLFLGKSHEEALAHLAYATSQGDGFVRITGEVGTGKTTLCRVFLENLDTDIDAAFIFNSNLTSVQLLTAIHRELGIEATTDDLADLTLSLNNFLLKKKAQGKSVILLIDEAQNLDRDTLEQLRMLSNLETTRNKLLQIILVGQPELGDILESYEMRQLRQRINLNCHILPLTLKETRNYIQHRINVASRKPRTLFTPAAQKTIFEYSRGVPRLINIACDRSLLAAYSLNQKKIPPSTVRIAIKELAPLGQSQLPSTPFRKKTVLTFVSILFVAIFFLIGFRENPLKWIPGIPPDNKTAGANAPVEATAPVEETAPAETPAESITPSPGVKPLLDIEGSRPMNPGLFPVPPIKKTETKEILSSISTPVTREKALSHVISLWGSPPILQMNPLTRQIESDADFFRITAAQNNLQMLHIKGEPALIKKYNLPAILAVVLPDGPVQGYVSLVEITPDNEYLLFQGADTEPARLNPDDLTPFLTGDIYIPWKDTFGYTRIVSESSPEDSIIVLKLLLRQMGFSTMDLTPVYDEPVKAAVKQLQEKYGLKKDGLVGPLTKIMLYSEKRNASVPYLDKTRFKGGQ